MITKQMIFENTLKLFERKKVDKVTVTDIVKECGIARSAFYYHFHDLFDLIEWGVRYEIDKITEQTRKTQNSEEVLLTYCRFVLNRRDLFVKVMSSSYNQLARTILMESTRYYVECAAKERADLLKQPVSEITVLLEYHTGAVVHMLEKWMYEKDVNLEKEISYIIKIAKGELYVSTGNRE